MPSRLYQSCLPVSKTSSQFSIQGVDVSVVADVVIILEDPGNNQEACGLNTNLPFLPSRRKQGFLWGRLQILFPHNDKQGMSRPYMQQASTATVTRLFVVGSPDACVTGLWQSQRFFAASSSHVSSILWRCLASMNCRYTISRALCLGRQGGHPLLMGSRGASPPQILFGTWIHHPYILNNWPHGPTKVTSCPMEHLSWSQNT